MLARHPGASEPMRRIVPVSLAVAALLSGCAHDFEVERRETPLHVWFSAPSLPAGTRFVQADVRVGPYAVVSGPVEFPAGVATVRLPTLYLRSGTYGVVAAVGRGPARGSAQIGLRRESWVHIVLQGDEVRISQAEAEPAPLRR